MRSNITISSNIYKRESKRLQKDPDFAKNVSGRGALMKLNEELKETLSAVKLKPVQEQELRESSTCSYAKNKEQTHGKVMVDGEVQWVCRCEYHHCPQFETCSGRLAYPQIDREPTKISDENLLEIDMSNFEYLGLDFKEMEIEEVFQEPTQKEEPGDDISDYSEAEIQEFEIPLKHINFIEIEEPRLIIESEISSKILVNAGPGTGKTYTVIQRLLHLLQNNLVEPDSILVLCYTRAAKAVITQRIQVSIDKGELPIEAKLLNVYTFDALATNYLAEIEADFQALDYNGRIDLFNQMISRELFEAFQYLIVDEIQDLVNGRATMVINLLKNMDCGLLLLGDRCQAIYDYDCQVGESINSTRFYEMLENVLPIDIIKYELTKNNRQVDELASLANEIRQSLLYSPVEAQNKFILNVMHQKIDLSEMKAEKLSPVINNQEQTAIICRNNGEAETISSYFHRRKIDHALLKGSNHPVGLHRWIGDVFWDYCDPEIGKDDFMKRYQIRVNDNSEEAEARFYQLSETCGYNCGQLNLNKLIGALVKTVNVSPELTCKEDERLIVSTIHRSKGREFDKVYLVDSGFPVDANYAEEARVRYVGITRPRNEIELVEKTNPYNWFFRRNSSGRTLRTTRRFYSNKTKFCSNLFVGLKGDLDPISFVSRGHADPLLIQQYIAEKIKVHDELEMIRDEQTDIYSIFHQGFFIGRLAKHIAADFWSAIYRTDDRRNIPLRLYDVYVSNITTIVNNSFDEEIPLQFRESKVWLGLEVSGLAKIEYPKWG